MLLVNLIYYHILELTSKYGADYITPSSAKLAKYSVLLVACLLQNLHKEMNFGSRALVFFFRVTLSFFIDLQTCVLSTLLNMNVKYGLLTSPFHIGPIKDNVRAGCKKCGYRKLN